ncbi:flagellar filament capping protein FliD [Cellulomonas soli]|uniref:flagellar filament capping protein FliD n=1 Tax=Cellulomonas soli TaxID=931535 RepID=UPI003F86BC5D
MATGIDGYVSGLDTTSLINSLMAVEANQQTLLKTKQSTASTLVTALQTLNTKVASLATAGTTASTAASWAKAKATSSDTTVTATASTSAQPASLSFRVTAVAAAQTSLASVPTDFSGSPTFTITHGTGPDATTSTVTAQSTHIEDIVAAFNADGTGVKASAINVGTSAVPVYKLQLTGAETGAANSFTVAYTKDDNGTPAQAALGLTTTTAASDASLTLFGGTAAEATVTSASNVFTGLATGVDVTVSAVTAADAADVKLTVARDTSNAKSMASALVSNLNVVLSEISSRSASTNGTAADGTKILKGGLFAGDSAIRQLRQDLLEKASLPVDGVSPSTIGLVINKDGTFTFDDALFSSALADDPAKVQSIVSGVAERLASTATTASNATNGTLTLNIQAQQGVVKDLDQRIADWDDRLAVRRESLTRIYTNLEVSLSNLQAQSTWLSGQLASLTSSTSSN